METAQGNYIFISYSRKDSAKVIPIVDEMQDSGYNVWYDKKIPVGKNWLNSLASHIKRCTVFVAFHSQTSRDSQRCQEEIHYALKHGKTVISVYLEDVTLEEGLDMQLARFQSVKYAEAAELLETLQRNPVFERCGGNISNAPRKRKGVSVKRIAKSLLVAVPLLIAIFALFMFYVTRPPIWFLDKGGVLDIISLPFLTVDMVDYNYSTHGTFNPPPWGAKTPLVECAVIRKGITHIGVSSFQDCSNMRCVFISEGVTSIGENAFFGCTALKEINLPYSLESLGWSTFQDCTGLKEIYNLGTIQELPPYVFYGCTGLEQIDFYGLEKIGDYSFSGCTGLESINLPSGVTHIGYGAFLDCTGLESVSFSSGVYGIKHSAYSTQVKFSEGIQEIGGSAFSNCTALKNITILNSIRLIGPDAFSGCTNLKTVRIQFDRERVQIVEDKNFFLHPSMNNTISDPDTLYIHATAFDPDTEIIYDPPVSDADVS